MATPLAIYVKRNDLQMGPYAAEVIQQLLFEGELAAEDLGWHVGLEEWQPLGSLDVLRHPIKKAEALAAQNAAMAEAASQNQQLAVPLRSFAVSRLVEQDPHLQRVGNCWYILALVLGTPAAFICIYSLPRQLYSWTVGAGAALAFAFIVGFFGYGIREKSRWAFLTSKVMAWILLPLFPIGTIVGLYVLKLLKNATPPKA
jgi:hypothetical protein